MLKTTTTQIHQNLQPHTHASFQRRTSASDTPLPAHIRTNLRAIFRGLTEPWDFSDYHGSKKTVIHDAQRLQRQWLGRSQKNLAKCIPTVAKYVCRKRPLGCQIWSRWQESATFNLPPSGGFTSKGQVRRLPPQMSRISDYAWLSADWILNQIVFVPGKFWEALSFNMDENHLSSLPLGGKNRQLSAWICTTCHAGVAWVLTAGCRGHIILLLSIFDQRFPTAANQPAADRMLSLHITLGDKFWASTKALSKHRNKCQEILALKYLYGIYMLISTYIYYSSELMQHHGLIYWKIHGNSSTSGVTALFSSVTSKSWPPGTSSTFSQQGWGGWNIIQTSWEYPPPKRKALLRDSWGIMVVNSPLLMPYFLWEVAFRRVYLRFPRK